MAVLNLTIAADADDGQEEAGTTWNDRTDEGYYTGEVFGVQADTTPSEVKRGALRFTGVTIAQGTVLTSAILTFRLTGGNSLDATNSVITITGDDVDNSAALSSSHRPSSGWTNTTATVTKNGLSTTGIDYTVDITTIVQEIIDRAGWASGNSLSLKLEPTGSDTYWSARIADYDADTSLTKARLAITTPDAGQSNLFVGKLGEPFVGRL